MQLFLEWIPNHCWDLSEFNGKETSERYGHHSTDDVWQKEEVFPGYCINFVLPFYTVYLARKSKIKFLFIKCEIFTRRFILPFTYNYAS